jgi:hypothetical protein
MDNTTWGKNAYLRTTVYFSVAKCPCLRAPINKCTSVVFDSKENGDLKHMITYIFFENMHLCIQGVLVPPQNAKYKMATTLE